MFATINIQKKVVLWLVNLLVREIVLLEQWLFNNQFALKNVLMVTKFMMTNLKFVVRQLLVIIQTILKMFLRLIKLNIEVLIFINVQEDLN